RQLLPPSAFLSVADDTGLVVGIGRHVLEVAARQVAQWRLLPGAADLRLSVNLSGQELLVPERAEQMRALLVELGSREPGR
ncbi:MAG: EAL domain-containing protein, partial [Proteobacteria bacterium]|nr:EAL domain-containing protein [Pseudomonadota bacterium]